MKAILRLLAQDRLLARLDCLMCQETTGWMLLVGVLVGIVIVAMKGN